MRILVTGGTGFIGAHLVAALRKRGDEVVCIVRRKITWDDKGIECVFVDLADSIALRHCLKEMKPCDAIVHFGAHMPLGSLTSLSPYLDINVGATNGLLETARAWEVKSFIYASSITVAGKPILLPISEDGEMKPEHPYLVSKYQAELACEYYRRKDFVSAFSLRITSPYGPGMNPSTVLPLFVNLARESKDIILYGTGARTQNFIHVSDVVRAVLLSLQSSFPGVYNIAGHGCVSMFDLAHQVIKAVPASTSQIKLSGRQDPQEKYRWVINTLKAEKVLGYFAQINLVAGLAEYIGTLEQGGTNRWWQPCA